MRKARERPEPNHRIQFHFTAAQKQKLDDIQEHLDLPSYVQVVRQLIAEYHSAHISKKENT